MASDPSAAAVRAVAYARVSSAVQRERETIGSQMRVLPEFIERMGWTLARPIGTYVDDGRTAKAGHLDARPGFTALLRDAAARAFDVVVVVDIDRLTRSEDMGERGKILGAFQQAGVRLASASTGQVLDLSTSSGDLFAGLGAFFAAEENRKRRTRTTEGKITAINRGKKPAGPTPYGLRYDRTAGTWSLHETRAPIAREIVERVARGESCLAIADNLDARGVPAPRTRSVWSRHAVWRIVRSSHTIGTWIADKRRRLSMQVPRIVTDEEWHAAQGALIALNRRGLRRTKHVYLLEGLATCGACGSPIVIRSASPARNGRTNPSSYICRRRQYDRTRLGEARCAAAIVQTADLDARVWARVAAALVDPQLAADIERRAHERNAEVRNWTADADGYRAHLARLGKVEARILALYRRGEISDAAFDLERSAAMRERAAVELQLATAERAAAAQGAPIVDPARWLARLRSLATSGTPDQRRAVVAAIVPKGGAVLHGPQVTLSVEVAAESRGERERVAPLPFVVVRSDSETHHETTVRFQVVA